MPGFPPATPSCLLGVLLPLAACVSESQETGTPAAESHTVVTFNTGTSEGLPHDAEPDDGYTSVQADLSDAWYGDGLAWNAALEDARAFLAAVDPVIVAFQEIFYTGDCAAIPEEAREGFVCDGWTEGAPTVAQRVLGDGWQVACHQGKPDKCAAVRSDFGRFIGCEEDFCLEGLTGPEVDGCGSGARVARGDIAQTDGRRLTLVNVHGSSGVGSEEQACRLAQFQRAFEDLVDPDPGARNLVLGDFNTDPGRWAGFDPSAAYLADQGAEGARLHFLTAVGEDVEPTYQGLANIDHVLSDALDGSCLPAGAGDLPSVSDRVYFDHVPMVCTVR